MRKYRRPGSPYWYVEISRGHSFSTKCTDESEVDEIIEGLLKKAKEERLRKLDKTPRISLGGFIKKYMDGRGHLSSDTQRADKLALNQLADVLGKGKPVKLIGVEEIQKFVKTCTTRRVKPVSVNTYLRHIKAALNTAMDMGYISKVPRIKMLRLGKRLHRVLSRKEITKLLTEATKNQEMHRIIKFTLWTGARRQEVLNLKYADISTDGEDTYCRIIGKGDKERIIPLLTGAIEAVGAGFGHVFQRMHKDTLTHHFKKIAVKAGLTDVTPHTLRHTSATYMIANGIPLEMVQKILGHSDIRTTQIYAEISKEVVADQMKKLKF